MFFLDELPTQQMLDKYSAQYPQMQPQKLYDALYFLRKASLMIRDLDAFFASCELSQTRFYILMLLDREPDNAQLTLMDICKKMNISKAVTSRTVNLLKTAGYIDETAHETDARAKCLSLTPSGREKLHAVLPDYYLFINSLEV